MSLRKNNISEHISYREATYSYTAMRNDIENTPTKEQLLNMSYVALFVFEPLRRWVNKSIKINSFFRSFFLNWKVGGAKSSAHLSNNKKSAIDIDDTYGHKSNKEMGDFIRKNLEFDQLIYEFPDKKGNPKWIHVSYSRKNNRNMVLVSIKKTDNITKKTTTKYVPYNSYYV